jgi:hypothetical protein
MKKVVVILLLPLLLMACAANNRQVRLDNTLRQYEQAIRWGLYPEAYALQKEPARAPDFDYLQEIKVTAYEPVGRPVVSEEEHRIDQTVEIRYYHEDYGREQVLIDKQVWRYDEEREIWLRDGEMPNFKAISVK